MCVVCFDDERLDAVIMEIKEKDLAVALETALYANDNGLNAIITQEDAGAVCRRLKRAGSVKRFLALLEASSKVIK